MRRLAAILLLLLAAAAAAEQKTLDQLKAEADQASGGHQAKLCADVARQLVEVANQQFNDGKSKEGQATVQELLTYATRARDVAIEHHGKMKETEIVLRETQRRLDSVKRTLAVEDRSPVDEVEKKLAQFRQDLLDAMFAPKHKEKNP